MRATERSAVKRNRRVDSFGVVYRESLLEVAARGFELAQITLVQPRYPVRLHEHRRDAQIFSQAQALLGLVETAFVLGLYDTNYRQTELRLEKLGALVQLRTKLARANESPLDFGRGEAFGHHQRRPQPHLQP